MTQALNLANFANNLNTSGATTNAGLQNSSVTVTAGTGMSGGGAVALGSSVTLTNAGVTSVVAGTGISVSGATGAVTISSSGASGTVTSVATGNGLSGGTITTSGTLTLGSVGFNTIGSYCLCQVRTSGTVSLTAGSTYSAGSGNQQVQSMAYNAGVVTNNLSGTWRYMGATFSYTNPNCCGLTGAGLLIFVRVA